MTGVRIQKLPMAGTASEKVLMALYQAPDNELTLEQLMTLLPLISRHTLTNTASHWGLCTDVPRAYRLPDNLRQLISGEAVPIGPEAPPVVQPRVVDLLHRPAWIPNISAQARRPDAGPAHDITHYSSGTVAEPKINGCAV